MQFTDFVLGSFFLLGGIFISFICLIYIYKKSKLNVLCSRMYTTSIDIITRVRDYAKNSGRNTKTTTIDVQTEQQQQSISNTIENYTVQRDVET